MKKIPKGHEMEPGRGGGRSQNKPIQISHLGDGRTMTRGIILNQKDLSPQTAFEKLYANAQDLVARQVNQVTTLNQFLKLRYVQVNLTQSLLHALSPDASSFRSAQDIINCVAGYFNADKEVQILYQLFKDLERARNGDERQLHIQLDSRGNDMLIQSRALLWVPKHKYLRKNPPFSGDLRYFMATSGCLLSDIYDLTRGNIRHLVMLNQSWESIQLSLWPESKGNPADMIKSNMSVAAIKELMTTLTLERGQVESAKKGFYILAAILGRLASDPQNFNITRFQDQMKTTVGRR